jgi:hypothetical protein
LTPRTQTITSDGVDSAFVVNVSGAEGPPGLVVVDGGGFQLAELGEELHDVGVGHAEVQVADEQLGRA